MGTQKKNKKEKTQVMTVIMSAFLERATFLVKNTKHMQKRHPKLHVSKQSCSNIHLSSKYGIKKYP